MSQYKSSHPAQLALSREKLRKYFWNSHSIGGFLFRFSGLRFLKETLLSFSLNVGDARAAVVLKVSPLLIAAYSDDMDCVAVLRMPKALVKDFQLKPKSCLVCVTMVYQGGEVAPDLILGPNYNGKFINFAPLIADFVTDDRRRLTAHKHRISPEEYKRCYRMGMEWLREWGQLARDGSPYFGLQYPHKEF